MITTKSDKYNKIYKLIIQNYFFKNKHDIIYDFPDFSDFVEYLNIANHLNNISINKTNEKNYVVMRFFHDILLKTDLSCGLSIHYLYDDIKNPFFTKSNNNIKLHHFCKIQNIYYSLLKFSNICKEKLLTPINDYDLLMNNLDRNSSFKYIDDNKLYLFSYSDIFNLFMNNICHCDNFFFSQPKLICNPYNQMTFSLTTLHNMYFFIKTKTVLQSKINIIDSFFFHKFNLINFGKNNESNITKYNIKRFVKNEPDCTIYPFIKELIKYSNNTLLEKTKYSILIDKDFPKKILCNVFKPYLDDYLNNKYNCDNVFRYYIYNRLRKKIIRFAKNSSKFGRRITRLVNYKNKRTLFVTDHIDYNKNDINNINVDYSNLDNYNISMFEEDDDNSSTHTPLSNSSDSEDEINTVRHTISIPLILTNTNIIQDMNDEMVIEQTNTGITIDQI